MGALQVASPVAVVALTIGAAMHLRDINRDRGRRCVYARTQASIGKKLSSIARMRGLARKLPKGAGGMGTIHNTAACAASDYR